MCCVAYEEGHERLLDSAQTNKNCARKSGIAGRALLIRVAPRSRVRTNDARLPRVANGVHHHW